jgi:DNA polymerase I-like protein with 3'-5' exonuclease and polymerase domains
MSLPSRISTIDFETEAITSALPPKPVGVSIKLDSNPSHYFAWGHPSGNNCTMESVRPMLKACYDSSACLFHNAAFDIAVAKYHFGLEFPAEIHDTILLLFLYDPHAKELGLKPASEKLLKMPPEERDLVAEWLQRNLGIKPKEAGANICKAPASLVGTYACGDTDRTYKLFELLYERQKGPAYERERQLLPILTQSTLDGVRLRTDALELDYVGYQTHRNAVSKMIYNKLGYTFNIDSAEELANAIDKSGMDVQWVKTATGKRSTSKPNMLKAIKDEELIKLLAYRSTLSTYLESFFSAWLSKQHNGRLHFSWNQVRNTETGGMLGTRTGRLSSQPSMLNVPKSPPVFEGLPPLPAMRSYLLPDFGDEWLKRDYQSQELRILAHYEDGAMMRAFQNKPDLDLHDMMAIILTNVLGREISRSSAKTIAFSLLYGQGLDAMAEKLKSTREEAIVCKAAYLAELAGINDVQRSIKSNWDKSLPIQTWGGRDYYKEPSKLIKDKRTGRERYADFTYKGLNYLIQGSSADVTKQALINYNSIKKDGRFLISVHDEIKPF